MISRAGAAVLRALGALGLADVLVLAGVLATLAGAVQVFGWPWALFGAGLAATAAGIALALRESRARRVAR